MIYFYLLCYAACAVLVKLTYYAQSCGHKFSHDLYGGYIINMTVLLEA